MSANQQDSWGETPLFYAMKWQRLETAVYLLQCGASMGVVNIMKQSAERLATVEMSRELHARMQEWAEPPTRKRRRAEEEDGSAAAEGPMAFEEWAARPAKIPKMARAEEGGGGKTPEPEILAEDECHKVTVVTADALQEVRDLQKMLVADQAGLFQGRLFVQSCRAADFCSALAAPRKRTASSWMSTPPSSRTVVLGRPQRWFWWLARRTAASLSVTAKWTIAMRSCALPSLR